ncbi:M24 family metallopeptidase [Sporolituus thermophilus]|uniref:Xaa-Pro aminopeptidase n=1 Tax=Sporolituus thermophilus DSM 23256 TaxID=1123285 RepID=A0A1G7ICC7_9FIRM|nr:Xaa-Pro peptidase family protein [Sporolituus thermophilus]SDF10305.1 Xaa-Pro aminopeptidase [Sporolituus thermophilus DSM 23256]
MKDRLKRLHNLIKQENVDGMIVTKPENRRYFSGFTGTAGMLLITAEGRWLITDFRYIEQAARQAPDFEVVRHGSGIYETLAGLLKPLGLARIGFEADYVTWDVYHALNASVGAELVPLRLDGLRMVKDHDELLLLKKAVAIADHAFEHILSFIKPGISEREIALELEFAMRRQGAEKAAFDIIVASGARSALPHGVASEKIIEAGDLVTLDFGAVYQGYHSDITRTVVIGRASAKQRQIYDIVLAAQQTGVSALSPGLAGSEVDKAARAVIADAGYGEFFGHGLGHGVGLAIHEEPRLSPTGSVILEENMVVTVEPGIYLPEWGGVRIEDMVVLTASGCEVLTGSSKQLIELDW